MFFDYASFLSSLSKNDFSCLKVSCFWSPNLQPAYLMCVHSRRGKGKSRPIQGPVWAAPLSNLASLGQAKGRVSKLVERYLNSICRFGSTGIYIKKSIDISRCLCWFFFHHFQMRRRFWWRSSRCGTPWRSWSVGWRTRSRVRSTTSSSGPRAGSASSTISPCKWKSNSKFKILLLFGPF